VGAPSIPDVSMSPSVNLLPRSILRFGSREGERGLDLAWPSDTLICVNPYEGFSQDAGPLTKLWAGVCEITGWRCRCPKCGATMTRELAADEAFVRTVHSRAIGTKPQNYQRQATVLRQVRTTPVYDVCARCGHRIRRRSVKTTVG